MTQSAGDLSSWQNDIGNIQLVLDGVTRPFNEWAMESVDRFYPDIGQRCYRVPALHFNRQKLTKVETGEGLELQAPDGVHARGDLAHTVVLDSLDALSRQLKHHLGKPLFIISTLDYDSYLTRVKMKASTRKTSEENLFQIGKKAKSEGKESKHCSTEDSVEKKNANRKPTATRGKKETTLTDANADRKTNANVQGKKTAEVKNVEMKTVVQKETEDGHEQKARDETKLSTAAPLKPKNRRRKTNTASTRGDNIAPPNTPVLQSPDTESAGHGRKVPAPGKASLPPRPKDMRVRGDIDVLLIHEQWGVVVMEVKSTGLPYTDWSYSEEDIAKSIRKAAGQVDLGREMFHYIMPDLSCVPCVRKVVALPFLSRELLHKVTEGMALDPDVVFLCQDDLPDSDSNDEQTPASGTTMFNWWQKHIVGNGKELLLNDMKMIVGRVCGLLSVVSVWTRGKPRVEVRTCSQAISETASRFSDIVLLPQQAALLASPSPMRVCLTGPMGSGKTLLLQLKGRQWVREGRRVVILNARTSGKGRPIAYVLEEAIGSGISREEGENFDATGGGGVGSVERYDIASSTFDRAAFRAELEKVGKGQASKAAAVIGELGEGTRGVGAAASSVDDEMKERGGGGGGRGIEDSSGGRTLVDGELKAGEGSENVENGSRSSVDDICFILDELTHHTFPLLMSLASEFPRCPIWCVAMFVRELPEGFQHFRLGAVLRSPPSVQLLLKELDLNPAHDGAYSTRSASRGLPCDGPPVIFVQHQRHDKNTRPLDCERCADDLVAVLTDDLNMNITCKLQQQPAGEVEAGNYRKPVQPDPQKRIVEAQAILFRDIMFAIGMPLGYYKRKENGLWLANLEDIYKFGQYALSSIFFKRLKERGVPFKVIVDNTSREIAVPSTDEIVVSDVMGVQGLERKVIIFFPGGPVLDSLSERTGVPETAQTSRQQNSNFSDSNVGAENTDIKRERPTDTSASPTDKQFAAGSAPLSHSETSVVKADLTSAQKFVGNMMVLVENPKPADGVDEHSSSEASPSTSCEQAKELRMGMDLRGDSPWLLSAFEAQKASERAAGKKAKGDTNPATSDCALSNSGVLSSSCLCSSETMSTPEDISSLADKASLHPELQSDLQLAEQTRSISTNCQQGRVVNASAYGELRDEQNYFKPDAVFSADDLKNEYNQREKEKQRICQAMSSLSMDDQDWLFVAASRCLSQLIVLTP